MRALSFFLRLVLRRLAGSPGFTLISLFTIAVGIAGNVAMFAVVNTLLLRPLPFPDSERLAVLFHTAPAIDLPMFGHADATYFYYRDESRTLEGIGILDDTEVTLVADGTAERLQAASVSASLFDVLRTPPAMGRAFVDEDERPGSPAVAIVSHGAWLRRFGGDTGVLGATLLLDGVATEVVGVMPAGFDFPDSDVEFWLPLELDPANVSLDGFGWSGIGRMRDGVEAADVEAELDVLLSRLEERFPDDSGARFFTDAGLSAMVRPVHEFVVGDLRAALWIVLGAVGFLLLIACANVANLFLARAEGRQQEIAIRRALGESRAAVVGSTLLESLTLGLAGGLVGLPIAAVAVRLLVAWGPQDLPRIREIGLDGRVALFALAISLVSGLLFGLLPALRAGLSSLAPALGDRARGASGGRARNRARAVLVAGQVAMALVLLVGSGLAARSFHSLSNVNPGFDPDGVVTFRLFLPEGDYADDASLVSFYRRVVDRIGALPAVETAAAVTGLPMSGSVSGRAYEIEGSVLDPDQPSPILFNKRVVGDYFRTLGIPLVAGGLFEGSDETDAARFVVVNEALAAHYWPGQSAIGKRLRPDRGEESESEPEAWLEVVGVVAAVRDRGLHEPPPELVYHPLAATAGSSDVRRSMSLAVRTPASDVAMPAVRAVVAELDPNLPVADLSTLRAAVDRSKQLRAFTLVLLSVAAGFALLLGAVGLYGVISYLVSRRGREIAIRMAVGARDADIRRLVLREALVLGGAGIVIGLLGAAALTRSMGALLHEVSPLDPLTYGTVPVVLLLVSLGASYLPARRAASVDPASALRRD